MTLLHTGEHLEPLRAALLTVIDSEWVGVECESANWHRLQDNLKEIEADLHVCSFDGPGYEYEDGSREIPCSVNPACHFTRFEEPNGD